MMRREGRSPHGTSILSDAQLRWKRDERDLEAEIAHLDVDFSICLHRRNMNDILSIRQPGKTGLDA